MSRVFQLLLLFAGLLICECSLWSQDSISLTSEKLYANALGSASSSSVLSLTPEIILVAYDDRSTEKGILKLGQVLDDSLIQFKDSVDFVPFMGVEKISLSRLSASRFMVSFILKGKLYSRAGEVIDESLIDMGGVHTIKLGVGNDFSQVSFSGNRFITAYGESDTGEGKCALGSVTEDLELILDSVYTFSPSGFSDSTKIAADTLSKSRFVISYGNGGGASILAHLDKSGILSFGNPFPFASNLILNLNVLGISSNKFALVYNDILEGVSKGAVNLGFIDESSKLSYSEKFYFDDKKPSGISATKLTPYEFIISYNGGWDDWHGYVVRTTVLGESVDFHHNTLFNPEPSSHSLSPITSLNNRDFLVAYLNRNTFKGYVRAGSTNEFKDAVAIKSKLAPAFSFYPNPARNWIHLELERLNKGAELRILDVNGRMMLSQKVYTSNTTLFVGNYPSGIYIIQLSDGGSIASRKFMVNNTNF